MSRPVYKRDTCMTPQCVMTHCMLRLAYIWLPVILSLSYLLIVRQGALLQYIGAVRRLYGIHRRRSAAGRTATLTSFFRPGHCRRLDERSRRRVKISSKRTPARVWKISVCSEQLAYVRLPADQAAHPCC